MKKQLILLVMMVLPMVASANAVEVDGIYYNLISKAKLAEVTSNPNKYSGNVVIPEKIEYDGAKYSVTSIGDHAFEYCTDLTSVTIGNSVTSIGQQAFYGCSGLTSVTIPNSVTSIGNYAFYGCSGLASITIPNSVTRIGSHAFQNCTGLTSIEIPNSVTSIGDYAFYGCSGLTSVTIGNSVTSIGQSAFNGCSSLIKVIVKDIAAWCGISFSGSYSNPLSYAHRLYSDENTEITELIIPNSVTSIGDYAFYGCSGLTSVTIGNSVTSIGRSAFSGCSSLTSVTIPNSVTSIGDWAFSSCSGLTSVTIPNSVTSIGEGAFNYCSGLKKVIVKDIAAWCGISFIGSYSNPLSYAHRLYSDENTEITELIIPNSVTSIGDSAFGGCSGLTSVTIPNSVTSIGAYAFSRCSGLTSVVIGGGVKTINGWAFANCPELTDVTCYAENVPSTESDAFKGSYIEYVTLHVPTASIDAYKTTVPWSGFKTIIGLDGTLPEVKKCATPTISFANGELEFSCETEGVEFVYSFSSASANQQVGNNVSLPSTYSVSVYAKKDGYENSDIVTEEIDVRGLMGDMNEDGNLSVTDVTILIDKILKQK